MRGAKVGAKALTLHVARQNFTRGREVSGVRGVCSSGFYGQEAWTVFTARDAVAASAGGGEAGGGAAAAYSAPYCARPCSAEAMNAHNLEAGGRACSGRYDSSSGGFVLNAPFTEADPACADEWSCLVNAELASGERANCTVLTREDEYCAPCPTGSACVDYTSLYSVEPVSVPGFWRASRRAGAEGFPGDPRRSHRPYQWDFLPCGPSEACLGNNVCKRGYTSQPEKCAACCDRNVNRDASPECRILDNEGGDVFFHRIYGKCEKCPQNIELLLLTALVALVVMALVGWRLHRKKVDLGIFSIGVDYFQVLVISSPNPNHSYSIRGGLAFSSPNPNPYPIGVDCSQVLAIFASTEVEWPASVEAVYRYMSLFNFSINLTPPECLFEVSYKTKWLFIEWFPTVMFGTVALLFVSTTAYFRYCSRHSTRRLREVRNSIIGGSFLAMYVLYLNISQNTLDPLNCERIEADDGTKSEDQFMISQPDQPCWTGPDTLQQQLAPMAFAFFFVYTLGYPLLVAAILLKPDNRAKCINDQYLRCLGTGSRKETNKGYFNFRSKYATLYFKFKPKYFYWILVIVLRKLLIVSFTLLFHINATMQLSMILLVVFLSYTLQVKHNPYLSRADYEELVGEMTEDEYQSLVGPYGTCPQPKGIGYETFILERDGGAASASASSRLSFSAAVEKMKRGQGFSRDELKAQGLQGLKFMFNYNTVESTLLFCSILVCLFGIMFASEFMTPGEPLCELFFSPLSSTDPPPPFFSSRPCVIEVLGWARRTQWCCGVNPFWRLGPSGASQTSASGN